MKRFLATAAAAVAGLVVAGPAAAEAGYTLGGGASVDNAVVTLVSNTGDTVTTNDWSDILFTGTGVTTFSSLTKLSAQFNVTDDACAGGSPRFAISFGEKTLQVYLGTLNTTTGEFVCTPNTWLDTGNLIGSTDARFDLTQFGGNFYGTYAEALALLGSQTVTGIRVATDAGWKFADKEQTVLLRDVEINNTTFFGTAQAKPKHAAQCKNGGWSSFTNPSFRNQGQCVKYVTHQRNAARKAEQRKKLEAQKSKAKAQKAKAKGRR